MKFTVANTKNGFAALNEENEVIAAVYRSSIKKVVTDEFKRKTVIYNYTFEGKADEVLEAMQNQKPKCMSSWNLKRYNGGEYVFQTPGFAEIEFAYGFTGGCAWFGNTKKDVIAKIKAVQKKGFVFEL